MRVKLIDPALGPDDVRIVPGLAAVGLSSDVPAGAVIDVPSYVAGARPHWRAPVEGDDLKFMETTRNDDGSVKGVHDLGFGLLAQIDVWAPDTDNTPES